MADDRNDFFYAPELELLPRDQLRALQLARLTDTVTRAYERVPHYQAAMKEVGVTPQDIRGLDDIRRLPFTTKDCLRSNYPFGMFAVPREQVVRLHASSGTTGLPTVVGYTAKDIDTWTELMARSMACAGARPGDVAHNANQYGMFTGGLGFHYGAERLGCTVTPMSGGNTARQLMLMRDFGATVLIANPSYAFKLAEAAEESGIDIKSKLRVGLFGAEPWSDAMRAEIESRLGIITGDFWGLSEMTGPGVSVNCIGGHGLHVWEDCFFIEIVDPVTMEPLGDGEIGEIVITTLAKQAQPILRYRTRDLSSLSHEPCSCGRTHARIQRVVGRSDDMLIIRGVNVFPSQIETVLLAVPGVVPHYELVVHQEGPMVAMTVRVEASPQLGQGEYAGVAAVVRDRIKSAVGVTVHVDVTAPGALPRWEVGKAVRVRDLRRSA